MGIESACIPLPSVARRGGGGGRGRGPMGMSGAEPPRLREVQVFTPRELPDFRPPIASGALRADLDGNLWIRTNPVKPIPGGEVWDVVTREGRTTDRLQLPRNYTLLGFGRDKVVFLLMREQNGARVARVRLK